MCINWKRKFSALRGRYVPTCSTHCTVQSGGVANSIRNKRELVVFKLRYWGEYVSLIARFRAKNNATLSKQINAMSCTQPQSPRMFRYLDPRTYYLDHQVCVQHAACIITRAKLDMIHQFKGSDSRLKPTHWIVFVLPHVRRLAACVACAVCWARGVTMFGIVHIPTTSEATDGRSSYTVFNIHLNGAYHSSLRYSQLLTFHQEVRSTV